MIKALASQAQSRLHGRSRAALGLPGALLLCISCLVLYIHVTGSTLEASDPLKTFLALIGAQMLPLVLLEMKIISNPDPAALLLKFSDKVLLMHFCFLALRVLCHPVAEVGFGSWNLTGLVAVTAIILNCHGISSFYKHLDVLCLVLLAMAAAVCTEVLDSYVQGLSFDIELLQLTIKDASDYIEILAFVPAVWMAHRDKSAAPPRSFVLADDAGARNCANFFFLFLVGFYVTEDMFAALMLFHTLPLAAAGHALHFLLTLDFTGFVLAHIYNPSKLKEELMRWLPDACLV